MSRQTDLSAFIAKKMNKNPLENDSIQRSDGMQRNSQARSSPSLLFQFKSNKKGNNPKNIQAYNASLRAQNERSNSINQNGKSKSQFSSSSIRKNQNRPKDQLSLKRVQSILGIQNKQNDTNQPQKQIQKVEDISEDTQVIQENTYALQVLRNSKSSTVNSLKCPVFVLIGPFDTIFADTIQDELEVLMQQCNKQKVIQFIMKQTVAQATNNLDLLQKITDEQFWCETMQTVVQLLQKNKRCLVSGIRTLPYTGLHQSTSLTRLQVFLIACSMFLCLIPKQTFCEITSFVQLMTLRAGDAKLKQKSPMRFQKLKCVINYMKLMCRNESIYEEKIVFQRVVKYDYEYLAEDRNKVLLNATVSCDKIEIGYCRGAIVDFANKAVGGGFLTNGCAQQQILFSIFPQLSIIKLICEELRDQQALVIKGARRFNLYSGYSHSFKLQGSYQHFQDSSISTIVAVDAVDYSAKLSKASQYTKKFLRRQLHKMYIGIQGACVLNNFQLKKVFTGKWGCGVFKGDQYLKFCVQWMVCSELGLEMNFMHDDVEKVGELRVMVKQLQGRPVSDLLGLMEQYGKMGKFSDKGLLNYLKEYS